MIAGIRTLTLSALHQRRTQIALAVSILALALLGRLILVGMAQHPGYGDSTFYYNVAENLVDGRGFEIDWNWTFVNNPEQVTHPSYDYWMPLTSILFSLPMFILGKALAVALLVNVVMGVLIAIVTYGLGKMYSGSRRTAAFAAGLVFVAPSLLPYTFVPDCILTYVFLVSLSLLCIGKGRTDPRYFLGAAISVALTYLTRQDGLLLLPILGLALATAPYARRTRFRYALGATGLFVATVLPLLIANYRTFGAPLPPGPTRTMFFTSYNDFFAFQKELTLNTYLDWGVHNILASKWDAAVVFAKQIPTALGNYLNLFVLVGVLRWSVIRDRRTNGLPALLLLVLLYVFYTLIATQPGYGSGFERGALGLVPFLTVIAVDTLDQIVVSKDTTALIVGLIACLFFVNGFDNSYRLMKHWERVGDAYAGLDEVLDSDPHQGDVVIMAGYPWLVYYATGQKTLTPPSGDMNAVYAVIQKYGVDYLILPVVRPPLSSGNLPEDRFEFVGKVPHSYLTVYRVK